MLTSDIIYVFTENTLCVSAVFSLTLTLLMSITLQGFCLEHFCKMILGYTVCKLCSVQGKFYRNMCAYKTGIE